MKHLVCFSFIKVYIFCCSVFLHSFNTCCFMTTGDNNRLDSSGFKIILNHLGGTLATLRQKLQTSCRQPGLVFYEDLI